MEIAETLELLCKTPSISGREKKMSELVLTFFSKYCDNAYIDKFHNCVGIKNGSGKDRKKIMITAHMDEIGFLVKSIDKDGFIKLASIGGIDPKVLLAKELVIHGKEDIFGVIGAKPPHLLKPEETSKSVKLEDLSVDTGMTKEKVSEIVSLGDEVTFRPILRKHKNGRVSSNGLDNKTGVLSLILIMEELQKLSHYHDIVFVATTQEEFNLSGVTNATYNIKPDVAIVIDVLFGETPDTPKDETYPLGKGPAIGLGPNLHRTLTKKLKDFAKDENIPYQMDIEPGNTGTEAWATQVSRNGISTLLISIPLKYMHTQVELVSEQDIKLTGRLTARFIHSLGEELEGLLCY
jgi:endoglucanase